MPAGWFVEGQMMLTRLLIGMVRGYQIVLGPHMGRCCRFTPSCSNYWIDALRLHGPWRGVGLGLRRLIRCRPFGPMGDDPVPARSRQNVEQA